MEELTLPRVGERIVRPSIYQAKENFEFAVRVFDSTPAFRARCRATMRRNIKAILTRLRERKRLYTELGLFDPDQAISDTCTAMCETEDAIGQLAPAPNVIAAMLLARVCDNCSRSDFAKGNGYCGTMAVALVSLRGAASGSVGADPRTCGLAGQQSDAAVVGYALRASLSGGPPVNLRRVFF